MREELEKIIEDFAEKLKAFEGKTGCFVEFWRSDLSSRKDYYIRVEVIKKYK